MPAVLTWIDRNIARLNLSVITVAEVQGGIAKSRRLRRTARRSGRRNG
jgi:predicted nucleic acid-binding protein